MPNENENTEINIEELEKNPIFQQYIAAKETAKEAAVRKEEEAIREGLLKNKNNVLEDYKKLQAKIRDDEVLKLYAAGNKEEAKRLLLEDINVNQNQPLIEEKNRLIDETTNENKSLKENLHNLRLQDKITRSIPANIKSKDPVILEEIQDRIKKLFTVNDKNELVTKEAKLNTQAKPYTIEDFFAEETKVRYWWLNGVSGSGTTDNLQHNANPNAGKLTQQELNKLSATEYKNYIKKYGRPKN